MGAKTDFWNPGLSGNVLEYDTEGLYLIDINNSEERMTYLP